MNDELIVESVREMLLDVEISGEVTPVIELVEKLVARNKNLKSALAQIEWANVIADPELAVAKCVEIATTALSKDLELR